MENEKNCQTLLRERPLIKPEMKREILHVIPQKLRSLGVALGKLQSIKFEKSRKHGWSFGHKLSNWIKDYKV